MSENTLDSGNPAGTPTEPTAGVSTGSAQPDSGGGQTAEQLLSKVQWLEGQVKALQSDKDRGLQRNTQDIKALKDEQKKLLERYDALLNEGLTPARAKREIAIDALLEGQYEAGTSAPVPQAKVTGTNPPAAGVDHTALLTSLGLDPNSAEVLNVVRTTDDYTAQVASFAALAAQKKSKPAPAPNPAQQVPVGGGSSVTVTTDSLFREYREQVKGLQGERHAQARFNLKKAIREKAAEADVPSPV